MTTSNSPFWSNWVRCSASGTFLMITPQLLTSPGKPGLTSSTNSPVARSQLVNMYGPEELLWSTK